jgi:hypothetical protein
MSLCLLELSSTELKLSLWYVARAFNIDCAAVKRALLPGCEVFDAICEMLKLSQWNTLESTMHGRI